MMSSEQWSGVWSISVELEGTCNGVDVADDEDGGVGVVWTPLALDFLIEFVRGIVSAAELPVKE